MWTRTGASRARRSEPTSEKLALNYQVHSDRVVRAAAGAARRARRRAVDGRARPADPRDVRRLPADRARTRTTGDGPAVAVLHAGWNGLLDGHRCAGVEALGGGVARGCDRPAIGPCCYEVGEEVAAPYRERFGDDVVSDGRLDLWTSAERALRAAGVEQVDRFDRCTACEPETFFSHRRDARPHRPPGGDRLRRRLRFASATSSIREEVGPAVTVVAATKYVSLEDMAALAEAGVEVVGENRAQDLQAKHDASTATPSAGTSSATSRAARRRS